MTLKEIKQALSEGKQVRWSNELYKVHKAYDQYLITCTSNEYTIGLTWKDGVTMNGKESDFYIKQ